MFKPTFKSYFTGMGMADIGFIQAGLEPVQSIDLDKHAVKTMQMNKQYFSHRILWDDISNITVQEQRKANIHLYTWPCQKYSMIGEIHGTRTGEDLYLHGLRNIVIEQPDVYICENVPGMKYFPVVMEAITKLPGYYINVFCPVNADLWLPQLRERLIIIGTKKPFSIQAPERCSIRPKIKDILEKDVNIQINPSVITRLKGGYRDKPIIVDPSDDNAIAPCCVAHYHKDMGTRLVVDKSHKHGVRPFTIREYARLQGVPDDYILPSKNYAYKLIGNGVPVHMARYFAQQILKYFN